MRKIVLNLGKNENKKRQIIDKLQSLIDDPLYQLDVEIPYMLFMGAEKIETMRALLNLVLAATDQKLHCLQLPGRYISYFLPPETSLHSLKVLQFNSQGNSFMMRALNDFLKSSSPPLEKLELDGLMEPEFALCYIKTLISLRFSGPGILQPVCAKYTTQLQALKLEGCNLSDASILDAIPRLTIERCNYISDISCLNNNEYITICDCEKIVDFSQSFAKSKHIVIHTKGGSTSTYDFTHWECVISLALLIWDDIGASRHFSFITGNNRLPTSVRKCILNNDYVTAIDFTVTSDHQLRELQLRNNHSIESLESFHVYRLVTLMCCDLSQLKTLRGLGQGKNRKIVIEYCPKIQDFSSVGAVAEVHIDYSGERFSAMKDFTRVKSLTIQAINSSIDPLIISDTLQSLTLDTSRWIDMKQLSAVPELFLKGNALEWVESYLLQGGVLRTEKLVISTAWYPQKREKWKQFYQKYLSASYIMIDKSTKPIVFLRRRKSSR